jgi:transcription antitermination factor NusB
MATSREIRRLAFQTLYQLDARSSSAADAEAVRDVLPLIAEAREEDDLMQAIASDAGGKSSRDAGKAASGATFTAGERRKAFEMAMGAFAKRAKADAFMLELAPDWPAHRQAAVDRAILRLAHWEMTSGEGPGSGGPAGAQPKIAVNEAIELAKEFSTEKSPAFINGLLDKLLKKVQRTGDESADTDVDAGATTGDGA